MDALMDTTVTNMITVYLAQIDSAMKISEVLAEHGDEEEISPDNLIIGLIYRLMVPMTDVEMKESMDKATHVMDGSSEEEDEEEEEEYISKSVINKVARKIQTNHCNCEICSKARVCLINYEKYEASDTLAEKFSNSIKHACSTHKLLLT
jgi:hypothetical protein